MPDRPRDDGEDRPRAGAAGPAARAPGDPTVTARSRPIRVLVVDRHPLTRSGLRTFLSADPGLELAGEAGGGPEALALVDRARPDVVLVDPVVPEPDGVELVRRLAAGWPGTKVVAFAVRVDAATVRRVLAAGGHGFLTKTASAAELARAILAVAAGRRVLCPEAADALAEAIGAPPAGAGLTVREQEVLTLVAAGLPNDRIAERLGVERTTVRFHLAAILGKLGVASRAEAMARAHERGLVPRAP